MTHHSDQARVRTEFGEKLAALRSARGLTQAELAARAVGVSTSYIGRLESGSSYNASLETVAALAAALGCTAPERESLAGARDRDLGKRPSSRRNTGRDEVDLQSFHSLVIVTSAQDEELARRLNDAASEMNDDDFGGLGKRYKHEINSWLRGHSESHRVLQQLAAALTTHVQLADRLGASVIELLDQP